jgi:putative hydrolase of the HAD superfamily
VYVPHALTWAIEDAETPGNTARFTQINGLGALPGLVRDLVENSFT